MNARFLKKTAVYLCCALWLVACAEKVVEPPENLIPQERMAEILYDLSLLNATSSISGTTLKEHGIEIMPYLYDKYGIDSLQFVTSDEYYASIPLTYEAIYKDVQSRLEKEVAEVEALRKQRSDSIRQRVDKRNDSISKAKKKNDPADLPKK